MRQSCMVMSPPRLWPLADCTTNYRPVLSSERAPQDEEQKNFPAKKGKSEIWSWAPNGCPTPRHTDWLTVSRKVTSTSRNRASLFSWVINTGTRPSRLAESEIWGSKIWSRVLRDSVREWLRWLCSAAIVNYRLVLSSERTSHINNPATSWQWHKSAHGPQMGGWHRDRLADWPSAVT
jgi:hypothetical protein